MIYEIMNWEPRNPLLAFAFIVFSFYVIALGCLDFAHGDYSCMNDAKFQRSNFCEQAAADVIGPKNLLVKSVEDAVPGLHLLVEYLNDEGIEIAKSVITLFVVIDPIGIVPLFASFTEKMQPKDRRSISQTATVTAGVLLFVFAIAGTQIFAIFGIDVFSFMIAGGILLFIVSIELLTHGAWRFGQDIRRDDSGVVPLAFPLLAGPGSITSVIILYQTSGIITTILSITIVISLTYIILLLVSPIYRVLGRRGSMVVTRVFAVLVAAFAVQYIVEGIRQIYFTMF